MSKSIYKEALLDLRMNDSMRVAGQHVLTREQYSNILKTLEQAQKQEKLLGLYKKLNELYKELITLARYNSWSWDLDSEIIDIQKQIKELENEKNNRV